MTNSENKYDRELFAIEALALIDTKGFSERDAINKVTQLHSIDNWRIRGAFHALVFETVRYRNLIDYIISSIMNKGTIENVKNTFLRNILRLGIFEIKIMNKSSALIGNTLVNITKHKGMKKASKFVNAILRQSDDFNLDEKLNKLNELKYLSLKYSHPLWFVKYLKSKFPREFLIPILERNNRPLPVCVRVNTTINSLNEVIEEIEKEDFQFTTYPELPHMIEIERGPKPIVQTKSYKNDGLYIQSKSSILVSYVLNPQPGEFILDLTAAPGSKTFHISQLMRNKGCIVSLDRSFNRLKEIKRKTQFFNENIINTVNFDSKYVNNAIKYKADRVVLDPPCSGTGTFSNRPLLKWKSNIKVLKTLTSVQWALLESALKIVKPSGIIIYSTCSITLEENEKLIQKLLKKHKDYSLICIKQRASL
ncbi:MAG: hypothetical protein GF329_12625 [Candidatus Lokiarchaeota archaeon]|nr:hypothetical protein [Candidatus Lokiarchaeota archaeon]